MRMLNEMAVFAQVVDSGSFAAAGRHLDMPTSSVSRHVSRLESALGGRLLLRSTRSLALTELGQQVHAACLRMAGAARDVHALAGLYGKQPTGTIKVSAPIVWGQVWLAPRLPGFLADHPGVNVQLTLTDRPVDLIDEGVDVAIRIARELAPGLAARRLHAMRFVLVASPAYLAAHPAPDTPAQLARHSLVYLGYAAYGSALVLRRGDEAAHVTATGRATLNNSGAIVAMVEAGGGIGLVPDFAAHASLASGASVQVLADWEFDAPYAGLVHLVYTPGRHLPLKVRAFVDHLVRTVDAPPGQRQLS